MRKTKKLWMLAAILVIICGTSVFTSCTSDNDDNPSPESGANGELVGQWYSDVSGDTYAAWTYGKAWQQTELKSDGTGVTNIYYLDGDVAVAREHYSFTYSATDGLLTMDIAERNTKTTARYGVSEGKLLLMEGEGQTVMQKMDDAKAKDFDAWNRKENLVNVPQPARYTVFVYGNAEGIADNIIEYGFWEKIKPLLTDHNNVRVVCFYKYGKDLPPERPFSGKYADPGDIVWFDLNDTTNLENIRNGGLQALGYEKEAQAMKLCDPKTISAFIQISSLVCPAEQYVFSIWGHGNGLSPMADVPGKYEDEDPAAAPATRGVIGDEWNEGEELDMYELSTAIRSAGLNRLNTIFFHNCLMGNMETLTELRGLSDYIVASAHLLVSEGELLTEYVRGLLEKGNTEDAIAQMFERVRPAWDQSYHDIEEENGQIVESWKNGDYKLIRTAKLDAIIDAAKRLADRLVALYPTQREAIDRATQKVYRFNTYIENKQSPDESIRYSHVTPFFDLADYAHLLTKETADAEMAAISADLDKAFSEAFVHYVDINTNEQHLDHYTLSVCLTHNIIYTADFVKLSSNPPLCNFDQGYEQTTFHKLTGWGNWLRTNQQVLWGNPTSDGGGPLK